MNETFSQQVSRAWYAENGGIRRIVNAIGDPRRSIPAIVLLLVAVSWLHPDFTFARSPGYRKISEWMDKRTWSALFIGFVAAKYIFRSFRSRGEVAADVLIVATFFMLATASFISIGNWSASGGYLNGGMGALGIVGVLVASRAR